MSKNKKNNWQEKPIAELKSLLREAQKEWMRLKMELKIGKIKDVHAAKKKRKEIAKIKTIIKEKQNQ